MSTADTAIAMIAKNGAMRTDGLSTALGMGENAVDAMLEPARVEGRLITCTVNAGGRQVIEYRCSAAGAAARVGPGRSKGDSIAHLFRRREETYGTSPAPTNSAVVLKPAIAPAPTAPKGESNMDLKAKVTEVFSGGLPLTSRELKALSLEPALLKPLIAAGDVKKLGAQLYGLPGMEAPESEKAPSKAKKRAGGGSVAMRRKRSVKGGSKAARKAWKTRRANARKNGATKNGAAKSVKFRPALAADGAILFMGAKGGDFEIPVAQARGLVSLVRKLTGPELAVAVGFVETLDRGGVGA